MGAAIYAVAKFVSGALAAMLAAEAALALDLVVVVTGSPATPNGPTPSVIQIPTQMPANGQSVGEGWVFRLNLGQEIILPLRITVEPPQGFQVGALSLAAPFFLKDGTIRLVMAPVSPTFDAAAVRSLYATNVTTLSDDALPVFYQQARAQAQHRMTALNGHWDQLHPYDVQAVFKFLEATAQLSRRFFAIPPQDVQAARDWMSDARTQNKTIVDKAVGTANADKIIADIDASEGARFDRLWKEIMKLRNCADGLPLMQAYKQLMQQVPVGDRYNAAIAVSKVPIETVESSIAQCVAKRVTAGVVTGETAKALLEEQIGNLERLKAGSAQPALSGKIDSDIQSLQAIRKAF